MDLGLAGRVALVAGSSKGLGRGVARALANERVSLVLCARGAEALEAAAAELRARDVDVLAIAGDVTEPEMPAELVRAALEQFGRLDIVVSNSGGPPQARSLEIDDGQVHAAIEANLLTHVRFVQAALPAMREAGFGRLVAISSFGVVQAIPTLALSNLARSGLRAWAKTAAADLAGTGVTLNLLAPGLHRTDRIRALGETTGLLGDPDDFGKVAAFLCSSAAAFVNGATLVVDGGATLAL